MPAGNCWRAIRAPYACLPILREYVNFNEWSGKGCPLRYRCELVRNKWKWYVGDGQRECINDMRTVDIQCALEDGRPWWGGLNLMTSFEKMPAKHRAYLFLKDTLVYELRSRGIDCTNI